MRATNLEVAGEKVSLDEALVVTLGYCLGRRPLTLKGPADRVGEPLDNCSVGAFAFDVYDDVPPASGARLAPADVFVADGLNAQMRSSDIAAALAVANEIGEQIERIEANGKTFWQIDDIGTRPDDEDHDAWPVWRAWTILSSVRGMNVARVHKILHHKCPTVFPLIDNQTVGALGGERGSWAAIRRDLDDSPQLWVQLEDVLNAKLVERGKTPIYRLRLHDILLWTRVTTTRGKPNLDIARALGEKILRPSA